MEIADDRHEDDRTAAPGTTPVAGAPHQPDAAGRLTDVSGADPADFGHPATTHEGQPISDPIADPDGDATAADIAADAAPILAAAPALARWLLIYSALRIALVVALAAVLSLFMPLIVALLFAIVLALPLSFLLFAGARRRVTEAIAAATARRRTERERLRAALNGEDTPRPGGPAAG